MFVVKGAHIITKETRVVADDREEPVTIILPPADRGASLQVEKIYSENGGKGVTLMGKDTDLVCYRGQRGEALVPDFKQRNLVALEYDDGWKVIG